MYIILYLIVVMITINSLCTIVLTSSTAHKNDDPIDPIVRSIKHIVDTALENNTSDDVDNDLLIKQLSQIIEREEGFRVADRKQRSLCGKDEEETRLFDGSGMLLDDEDLSPLCINMNITYTVESSAFASATATAYTKYPPYGYGSCPCTKGERGEKGEAGVCPQDCGQKYISAYNKACLGSRINIERLAQSIRQLIIDTKQIAYRNARATSCVCSNSVSLTTKGSFSTSMSGQFSWDSQWYSRFKGEKGDRGETGTSCSSTCTQSLQSHIRVFSTLKEAMEASFSYSDHTYVHIVNEHGRLQGVFIRIHGQLIPIRIESDKTLIVHERPLPPTTISISRTQCKVTLPCSNLHMFAIGPQVRHMCNKRRGTKFCSKLSDYDALCERESERQRLKGFYRAFMSTSTQWLSNLFDGICVSARLVNMHEQVLFENVYEMFEQKAPRSEILDVRGLRPQFQYWWHGSYVNGTTSSDTCLDWSRQDSNLSGMASRLPDGVNGLFHNQYTWPCSIGDSNMGILCIETNCDKTNYQKH